MNKTMINKFEFFFCLCLAFAVLGCSDTVRKNHEGGEMAYLTARDLGCPVPMAWLKETPIPIPDYANFPCGYTVDNTGGVTNMAFHEISWQYFLWLMEEVKMNGKSLLRFETMYNDASINMAWDNPKAQEHILGGIQQAGGTNSILVDKNNHAIYTSMIINSIYRNFVQNNDLNTQKGLEDFSSTANFPDGSMSLKAAWKIIPDGQFPPKGAYTRKATLYKVVEINGELTTSDNLEDKDPKKGETIKRTVALVGFHIAVVVKDHPEFIWTTFEYNDNAPNYESTSMEEAVSMENYTFYKAKTIGLGCNRANGARLSVDKNQNIYKDENSSAVVQVFRQQQFGGGDELPNQKNIHDLNEEIHPSLKGSIWQNYHEVGAVWFNISKGKLVPDWNLTVDRSMVTGSLALSNSVIETFTQDPFSQNSCFSCHNTSSSGNLNGKNVLTSHILLENYLKSFQEPGTIINVERSK